MSHQFRARPFDAPLPDLVLRFPPLPTWLADRLLRTDEKVTWVHGPKSSPPWERFVTHPALFLVALALAAVGVVFGWELAGDRGETFGAVVVAAGGLVIGSIFVLGMFSGYFTRLVVTNFRLFIVQGYEMCSSWDLDHLPLSLIRYSTPQGGPQTRTIDVGTVQSMLGSSSEHVADARTILSFGKQLDLIRARENRLG
jgi:hypothetical protein